MMERSFVIEYSIMVGHSLPDHATSGFPIKPSASSRLSRPPKLHPSRRVWDRPVRSTLSRETRVSTGSSEVACAEVAHSMAVVGDLPFFAKRKVEHHLDWPIQRI
jgi:hypothetical protein